MKNTLNELWQFFGGLCGGFAIGFIYRIFSLFRMGINGKWANAVMDIIFYALAGALAAFTLLTVNGGELRAFVLAAIAGGAFLFVWASRDFIKTIFKMYKKLLVKRK